MKRREKILNTIAVVVIALSLGWCYLIRDRIVNTFVAQAPLPPSPTRQYIEPSRTNSPLPFALLNGVKIRPIEVEPENLASTLDRTVGQLEEAGWVIEPMTNVVLDGQQDIRALRNDAAVRVLFPMQHERNGTADVWLMDLEFPSDIAAGLTNAAFSLEELLHKVSRDLDGVPAPEGAQRVFSLEDHGSNMDLVSYMVPNTEAQERFVQYQARLRALGWRQARKQGMKMVALFHKNGYEYMIGLTESYREDSSLITVIKHGAKY